MDSVVERAQRRLDDLETHQLPSLRSAKNAADLDDSVTEIRQDFETLDREIAEVRFKADDCANDTERDTVLLKSRQLADALTRLRGEYRQAALAAKRRLDSSRHASGRTDLLQGRKPTDPSAQKSAESREDTMMTASADVTIGLRRTLALMQQELDRSVLSNQMLEESSNSLRMTSDQYTTFSSLLNASKAIITSLERADMLDRLLILAALIFFGLVCAYIIKRRVVNKGLRVVGFASKLVPRFPKKVPLSITSAASVTASISSTVSTISAVSAAVSTSTRSSLQISSTAAEGTSASAAEPTPLIQSVIEDIAATHSKDDLFDRHRHTSETAEAEPEATPSEASQTDTDDEFDTISVMPLLEEPAAWFPIDEETEPLPHVHEADTGEYPEDDEIEDEEPLFELPLEDIMADLEEESDIDDALEQDIKTAMLPVFGSESSITFRSTDNVVRDEL